MTLMIGGHIDDWGFIPSFLSENNPKTAIQQLNDGQPGGQNKFEGFKFDPERKLLTYPGDPPMKVMSELHFKNDIIMLFPHAWILVLQPDGKWEVARCD